MKKDYLILMTRNKIYLSELLFFKVKNNNMLLASDITSSSFRRLPVAALSVFPFSAHLANEKKMQ